MLQFADRAWSDEQKEFRCNTKEPGCENVCFNQFAPISNVRLWGLQLLGCAIPACLYLVYVLHLVSRAQADEREKKRIVNQIKQNMDVQNKQANNNHAENAPMDNATTNDDGSLIKYIDPTRPTLIQEGLSLRKIHKYQKRQRKYSIFNKMILPAEYRHEAQARSSTERKIWRFYIFQIFFRTCIDFGFISLQYNVYPYKFVVPEIYICEQKPCPWKVDCFVSRPTEKTIFFNYKYIIALITCVVNVLELWFIGWCRIRRAFKEDGPPPYADIFNAPTATDLAGSKKAYHTEETIAKSAVSSDSTMPISDHLSERYDLPPSSTHNSKVSVKLDASKLDSVSHRRPSKDKFSKMDTIPAETTPTTDAVITPPSLDHMQIESCGQSSNSTTPSKARTSSSSSRPQPTRRNKSQRDHKSAKINQNHSNVHCYYEPKPFSPPGSVNEPYLQ